MSALDGCRVLDLSRLIPGPFCTLILAELGADVVKVEDTGAGDYLRQFPPLQGGLGAAFYALNRGKRSIALDLKQPAGRELFLRLLPGYDVVVESFRPGVLDRLGIGYQALVAAHPGVILCSISGFGQDGPLRDRAGHDITYQALAGTLSQTPGPDGVPAVPGVQLADMAGGGLWAAVRILAALRAGQTEHLDVSMTEGALSLLTPWLGELAFGGEPLTRGAGTLNGGAARYAVYPTADGGNLAVGALEPKFWSAMCGALGRTPDTSDLGPDAGHQQALRGELARQLGSDGRDAWAERLAAADACAEPVLELGELAEHPQHRHRGAFFELADPARGPLRLPRLPLGAPRAVSPAPAQGEHGEAVLREAGFEPDQIARLRQQGVIK